MDRKSPTVYGNRRKRPALLEVDSSTVKRQDRSITTTVTKPSARENARTSKKAHRRARHGSKMSKARSLPSLLERLPGELLSIIFLECMEPSLPLSSPRIAAKLSSRFVLLEYSLHTLELAPSVSIRPAASKEKNQLLSRRFFTWGFLSALLSAAAKRYAPINEYSRIFVDCFLPYKLLHGPWTNDKVKMLGFLTERGECWVRRDDYSACQIMVDGVYDAIRGNLFEPLDILLHSSLIEETVREPKRYPELPPVKYIYITLDMVHTAVFEHGCPIGVACLLLIHAFRNALDVDFLDAKLWSWAEYEGRKGAWIQWLLRGLSRMKDQTLLLSSRYKRDSPHARVSLASDFHDVSRLDGMIDYEPEEVVKAAQRHLRETLTSVFAKCNGMRSKPWND